MYACVRCHSTLCVFVCAYVTLPVVSHGVCVFTCMRAILLYPLCVYTHACHITCSLSQPVCSVQSGLSSSFTNELLRSGLVSVSVARAVETQRANIRTSSHSLSNLQNKYQHCIHKNVWFTCNHIMNKHHNFGLFHIYFGLCFIASIKRKKHHINQNQHHILVNCIN